MPIGGDGDAAVMMMGKSSIDFVRNCNTAKCKMNYDKLVSLDKHQPR